MNIGQGQEEERQKNVLLEQRKIFIDTGKLNFDDLYKINTNLRKCKNFKTNTIRQSNLFSMYQVLCNQVIGDPTNGWKLTCFAKILLPTDLHVISMKRSIDELFDDKHPTFNYASLCNFTYEDDVNCRKLIKDYYRDMFIDYIMREVFPDIQIKQDDSAIGDIINKILTEVNDTKIYANSDWKMIFKLYNKITLAYISVEEKDKDKELLQQIHNLFSDNVYNPYRYIREGLNSCDKKFIFKIDRLLHDYKPIITGDEEYNLEWIESHSIKNDDYWKRRDNDMSRDKPDEFSYITITNKNPECSRLYRDVWMKYISQPTDSQSNENKKKISSYISSEFENIDQIIIKSNYIIGILY